METLRIALSPDGPDNTVLMPAQHWPVLPCVYVCMLQNEQVSDRSSACTSVCAILTRKQQVVVDVHIRVLQELKSPCVTDKYSETRGRPGMYDPTLSASVSMYLVLSLFCLSLHDLPVSLFSTV